MRACTPQATLLAAALLLGSLPAHAAFDGPCFPVPVDDDNPPTIVIVITGS